MALSRLRVGPVAFSGGPYGGAAAFLIGGLVVTDPQLQWVALASYAVALYLVVIGTTIHGLHLWQPWWRGRPKPLSVKAWAGPWRFEDGADVGGIRWHKAFAQIRVDLTNVSSGIVQDVTARLRPDQPIIQSRAKCAFAECRIGPETRIPDITMRVRLKDGREVDVKAGENDVVGFGPPHQLVCERLPAGAVIEINLATVVPNELGTPQPFKPERSDPEYIDIALRWEYMGEQSDAHVRFTLRNDE